MTGNSPSSLAGLQHSSEDGQSAELVLFDDAVAAVLTRFPDVPASTVVRFLIEEWNAFTGGRPSHLPPEVVTGAMEMLSAPRAFAAGRCGESGTCRTRPAAP